MVTDAQKLLVDTATLMEIHRLELPPAFYGFGAELVDGEATGRIKEMTFVVKTARPQQDCGVIFGFWPEGFERGGGQGNVDSVSMPPPIREFSQLGEAPEGFLSHLALHVRARLELLQLKAPVQAEVVETDSPAHLALLAKASMTLEVYRRMVPRGFYRF